jgi:hypothetical protein
MALTVLDTESDGIAGLQMHMHTDVSSISKHRHNPISSISPVITASPLHRPSTSFGKSNISSLQPRSWGYVLDGHAEE